MGSPRTVENRFTFGLEGKGLSVFEGVNSDIERHIQVAHRREGNAELRINEKVGELLNSYPDNAALYSLGKELRCMRLQLSNGKRGRICLLLDLILCDFGKRLVRAR